MTIEDLRQVAEAPLDRQDPRQVDRVLDRMIPEGVTLDVAAFNSSI